LTEIHFKFISGWLTDIKCPTFNNGLNLVQETFSKSNTIWNDGSFDCSVRSNIKNYSYRTTLFFDGCISFISLLYLSLTRPNLVKYDISTSNNSRWFNYGYSRFLNFSRFRSFIRLADYFFCFCTNIRNRS